MITIICSTYNSAKWINGYLNCINSITSTNFNIIFVDSESTDGSYESIQKYKFRSGIHVDVMQHKCSLYHAWNTGVEHCDTEYIMNLNTDDRLYPCAIDIYTSYASRFCDTDIFYSSYAIVKDHDHNHITGVSIAPKYSHERLLSGCFIGPYPLMKRETIVQSGLFNTKYTISGDYEMWLRLSKSGKKFTRIPEIFGSYYNNPVGISTNKQSFHEHLRQDIKLRTMYK